MLTKTAIASTVLATLFGSTNALADQYSDYAIVRSSTPEYERVNTPREECRIDREPSFHRHGEHRESGGMAGPLIGGVTGAIVGRQIGRGNGSLVGSAAGAIIGTIVGDRLQNGDRRQPYYQPEREVRRCQVYDDVQTRLIGYRVVYEYNGRSYSTVLPNDPGHQLRVRVMVDPAS